MEENQIHIPDGWESYVGNEILKVQGGYAFKSNDYRDEGILLVRIGNVGNGSFVFKDVIYVPKRFQLTHSNFQLWKGDVLMGLTGDLGKICILKEGDFPYFLNQRVGKFIATDKIDNEYLYYLVSSSFIQSKFDAFFAGGAQKNISPKQIESINYLIPNSKIEQTQIATILSKLDEAIAQTEQLIAKYTRIKTGLMQDLLTKGIDENGNIRSEETHEFKDSPLGRIPKEWECEKLERYGSFSKGATISKSLLSDNGVNCILYGELYTKYDIYAKEIFSKVPFEFVREKQPLKYGDILFAGSGETHEDIGKCITFIGNKPTYAGGDIVIFRSKHFNPIFLSMLLNSFKLNIQKSALGQGSSVIHIYPNHLKMLDIIFPDKVEQDRIAEIILKNEMYINDLETNLSKLYSLKTGLMQDLLSGKVRVNHLIKETASV